MAFKHIFFVFAFRYDNYPQYMQQKSNRVNSQPNLQQQQQQQLLKQKQQQQHELQQKQQQMILQEQQQLKQRKQQQQQQQLQQHNSTASHNPSLAQSRSLDRETSTGKFPKGSTFLP